MKAFFTVAFVLVIIASLSACSSPSAASTTGAPPQAPSTPSPLPSLTGQPTEAPAGEPTAEPTPTPEPTPAPLRTASCPEDFDVLSESLGPVRLGMTESEILATLGHPDEESEVQEWGADGMLHSDWTYKALGLTLNMSDSANPGSEFTVFSISAAAPCKEATRRGIKIGDAKDAVLATYADAVNPEESSANKVVVGSVFGGGWSLPSRTARFPRYSSERRRNNGSFDIREPACAKACRSACRQTALRLRGKGGFSYQTKPIG